MKNLICRVSKDNNDEPLYYIDGEISAYTGSGDQLFASQIMASSNKHFTLVKHKPNSDTSGPFYFALFQGFKIIGGAGFSKKDDVRFTYFLITREKINKVSRILSAYTEAIGVKAEEADVLSVKKVSRTIINITRGLLLCLAILILCLVLF